MKKLLIAATASAALLAPGLANAADLTGDWKLELMVGGMTYHSTCHFTQSDAAIGGTCQGEPTDPAAPVKGSLTGTAAKWEYDITYQGMPLHLTYTGEVKSDTSIEGAIDAGVAQGAFTATKQ